jgi:hypothetical protein
MMDAQRQKAYRYLLYHAMLDIRQIAWTPFGFSRFLNPFKWRATNQRIRRAGVVADWLHNLALFSALDFERFDEERFWRDFRLVNEQNPDFQLAHYEDAFERVLSGSAHITIGTVPLSSETERRVDILFDGEDAVIATRLLTNECGRNLPFCENDGPLELERLRFAALKISAGSLERLQEAVELAKQDWRDLLVSADFANDVHAHREWIPQKP